MSGDFSMTEKRWASCILLVLVLTSCSQPTAPVTSSAPKKETGEAPLVLSGLRSVQKERPPVLPQFVDVAESSGIQFRFFSDIVPERYFLPEIMGGGAAWLDFDGDGLLDVFFTNGCELLPRPDAAVADHVNGIFRNRGNGQFDDVSRVAAQPMNRYGQAVAVGDYDGDGFPDVFLANYGIDVLLHNNGDGTFSDVAAHAGLADELWGSSSIWLDIDDDGDLDLYVTNYVLLTPENSKVCEYDGIVGYCGPGSYEAAPDKVFANQGDGTFVDRTEEYGFTASNGKGLAIAALDMDNDARPEIYVANDMAPNFLFTRSQPSAIKIDESRPTQLYRNIASEAGCAVSGAGENEASMGVACADFDGDQLVDIYLTHYYRTKNTLYRNLGELAFHDDSFRTRVAATSFDTLGFGVVPFDFDQDTAVDLFITNGHVLGPKQPPELMPPLLLRNNGSGAFADITEFAGPYFQDLWIGRGAAGGDYDDDGDVDLLVTHITRPAALLRNDTKAGHHWVGFDLSSVSRLPPIGGRVVVRVGEKAFSKPVIAGGSYLCNGDPRILFGLGEHGDEVSVEVYWPSGRVDSFSGLACDGYWKILEGETPQRMPSAKLPENLTTK